MAFHTFRTTYIELFLASMMKASAQSSRSVFSRVSYRQHHWASIWSCTHDHVQRRLGLHFLYPLFWKLIPLRHEPGSASAVLFGSESTGQPTHSVSSRPGSTALTLIFGPCVTARHFMRCKPAAFVTLYGIELPPGFAP